MDKEKFTPDVYALANGMPPGFPDKSYCVKDGGPDPINDRQLTFLEGVPDSLMGMDATGLTEILPKTTFALKEHVHPMQNVIFNTPNAVLASDDTNIAVELPKSYFSVAPVGDQRFTTDTEMAQYTADIAAANVQSADAEVAATQSSKDAGDAKDAAYAAAVSAGEAKQQAEDAHADVVAVQTEMTAYKVVVDSGLASTKATADEAKATADGVNAKAQTALDTTAGFKGALDAANKAIAANKANFDAKGVCYTDGAFIALTGGVAAANIGVGALETQVGYANGDIKDIKTTLATGVVSPATLKAQLDPVVVNVANIAQSLDLTSGALGKRIDALDKAVDAMDDYNMKLLANIKATDISKGLTLASILAGTVGPTMMGVYQFDIVTVIDHVEYFGSLYAEVNRGAFTDIRWKPDTAYCGKISMSEQKLYFSMPVKDEYGFAIKYLDRVNGPVTSAVDVYASIVQRCHNDLSTKITLLDTTLVSIPSGVLTGGASGFLFGADTNKWSTQSIVNNRVVFGTEAFKIDTANSGVEALAINMPNLKLYSKAYITYNTPQGDAAQYPNNNCTACIPISAKVSTTACYPILMQWSHNINADIQRGTFSRDHSDNSSTQPDWHTFNNTILCAETVSPFGLYIDYNNNKFCMYTPFTLYAWGRSGIATGVSVAFER